jgi:hypothetical protein
MKAGCARLIPLVSLLLFAAPSFGQAWSGILAPDRATDWTQAGIPGGIPDRTNVCANLTAGASTSTIQSAINNCPVGQVVKFGAGTFNVTGLTVNKGVVLRGQGPNSTLITLNGNIFLGANGTQGLGGAPSSHTIRAWTGGLTGGSTVLTLANTTGLSAGQTIILDELNRSWVFTSGQSGNQGSNGRGDGTGGAGEYYYYYGSTNRAAPQMTKIVSVNNGTQITIKDPVAYTHVAGSTPQVFTWAPSNVQYAGVEDMRVDANQKSDAIALIHCDYCWVKNVRVDDVGRSGVTTRWGYGSVLRDSYMSSALAGAPTQYGTECFMASHVLIENNIFWNVTSHLQVQNCFGNVYGYNYVHNAVAGNLYPEFDTHGAHNHFHLVEGNDIDKIQFDNVWGSSSHNTVFRNRANGAGSNKVGYRTPIVIGAHNRHINVVANVLGTTGLHTNYQCDDGNVFGSDNYIFDLGFWNGCPAGLGSYDTVVDGTVMIWGNWDADTYAANGNANGVRYCTANGAGNAACTGNERATADPTFPGLTSPRTTFPASLYRTAKPGWFGTVPWPAAGPDVTCTANCVPNAANKANKIPARLCYESSSKDGNGYLTAYDAQACYANDTVVAPEPPRDVVVQ